MIVTCNICSCVSSEETECCYFNVSLSNFNLDEVVGTVAVDTVWEPENRMDYTICSNCFKNWVKDKWENIIVVYRILDPIEKL